VDDPEYRARLKARLLAGTLAPGLECLLWHPRRRPRRASCRRRNSRRPDAICRPKSTPRNTSCSFEAAVKGAIFAKELEAARSAGRIGTVPIEAILPVDTTWDLGVGDATAIWFTQSLRSGEVRVIDYYEASGERLPHYVQVLRQKGYTYGEHWAPPDIQVREFVSGRSRLEAAASLGITFRLCPDVPVEEGIHAARMLFPQCWFDATRCRAGLEALQHYRRDYNSRLHEFKATPVHDWASHGADAFRYLAVRQQTPEPEQHVEPYKRFSQWS
jgi:hypothetical protein